MKKIGIILTLTALGAIDNANAMLAPARSYLTAGFPRSAQWAQKHHKQLLGSAFGVGLVNFHLAAQNYQLEKLKSQKQDLEKNYIPDLAMSTYLGHLNKLISEDLEKKISKFEQSKSLQLWKKLHFK